MEPVDIGRLEGMGAPTPRQILTFLTARRWRAACSYLYTWQSRCLGRSRQTGHFASQALAWFAFFKPNQPCAFRKCWDLTSRITYCRSNLRRRTRDVKIFPARGIFDVSIFQRHRYPVRIFGNGVEVPAAVVGEASLAWRRRRPAFSGLDDSWAPPVPAGESRSGVPDARESLGGANRWLVVESGPVSAFGEHAPA